MIKFNFFTRGISFILISSILLLSLIGCSENTPKQLIRIASSSPAIELISNEKDITDIKELVDNVDWMEGTINRPDREEDYQFWLEEESVEERLANYDIWYEDNQTIIFNSIDGKVGQLNEADAQLLRQYFISATN